LSRFAQRCAYLLEQALAARDLIAARSNALELTGQ
jgi:hypothetical protein